MSSMFVSMFVSMLSLRKRLMSQILVVLTGIPKLGISLKCDIDSMFVSKFSDGQNYAHATCFDCRSVATLLTEKPASYFSDGKATTYFGGPTCNGHLL